MRLILGNKSQYAIRMTILVMLFQLLSPAVSALMAEPQKSGSFSTICTIQGYQQVWIETGGQPLHAKTSNCPVCLLNLGSIDTINPRSEYRINMKNESVIHLLTIQSHTRLSNLFQAFAIRAPPLFS